MVKPIRLEELALRVRALLRRAQLETERDHVFPYETRLQCLNLNGFRDRHNLSEFRKKEFYVLYKLLSNPEKIYTRLDLLDDIWGMEEDLSMNDWWICRALNGFAKKLNNRTLIS